MNTVQYGIYTLLRDSITLVEHGGGSGRASMWGTIVDDNGNRPGAWTDVRKDAVETLFADHGYRVDWPDGHHGGPATLADDDDSLRSVLVKLRMVLNTTGRMKSICTDAYGGKIDTYELIYQPLWAAICSIRTHIN